MNTRSATSDLPYRSDTSVPVPTVARRHANGRIPDELLEPCGIRSFKMVPPAAGAMRAMVAAAAGDGVTLSATGTWRSYERQEQMFLERYVTHPTSGRSKVWEGRTYWKRPDVAGAATPGTSNHGLGLAVDLSDSPTIPIGRGRLDWLSRHGPSFGFWNTVRSEVWHWTYCLGDEAPAGIDVGTRTGPVDDIGGGPGDGAIGEAVLRLIPFRGELTIGARGDAVRAVQSQLIAFGQAIVLDGDFGPQTLGAVKAFQRSRGLAVDGRVGPKTWGALGLPFE